MTEVYWRRNLSAHPSSRVFNAFPCNGSGRLDSNQRSSPYEGDEIDHFSTPVHVALRSASHTSFPYLYPAFQSVCSSGRGRCWWSGTSTSQVPLQVCWEPFPTSTTNHGAGTHSRTRTYDPRIMESNMRFELISFATQNQ